MPIPLPYLNPCRAPWRYISILRRLFIIVLIIFQVISTITIPLQSPFLFVIRIIVVQVSSASTLPSQNVDCVILTNAYHPVLSVSFSRVDSLGHIFVCSTRIPDVPPILPELRPHTVAMISYSLSGPYGTAASWINNGMGSPTGIVACRVPTTLL